MAALVVVIALVGAVYLGSLRLGGSFYEVGCGLCTGPSSTNGRVLHFRAGWQIPIATLSGVLGVVGGALVLRTRPRRPPGSSAQAA